VANYQAIGSVAEAVRRLLEQSWPSHLGGLDPLFEVYNGANFSEPMTTGISVFVYQVAVDSVQRTLPPYAPDRKRPLPVCVWLLLTAWAKNASSEHTLLGWAMRAIADNPTLSSGFLNAAVPGVFRADETVELVAAQLSNDEVFQLWQAMPTTLQLSMPYQARVLRIESDVVEPVGAPVQLRELHYAEAGR
jgi:Pvc16 N-terminal domain